MISLRWLPEALVLADEGAHLIDLYTNTSWDGWAKTVSLGGTVTWESWCANLNNDSMSHPWGAVGLLAMEQYMLGIQSVKPQHELIRIKPLDFGGKLTYVRGTLPTDKGDISIYWTRSNNDFSMKVNLPDNITAKIYVPRGDSKDELILVDGTKVAGKVEGNYLYVDHIGSGLHFFERKSNK